MRDWLIILPVKFPDMNIFLHYEKEMELAPFLILDAPLHTQSQ
mgnify:CR=1 FL=1